MARIKLKRILKGQIFWEIDHKMAVRWRALESSREIRREVWSLRAVRDNGTEIEFTMDDEYRGNRSKLPELVDSIHEDFMVL